MLNLVEYRDEILAIAMEHAQTWDVARDMFVANVEKGKPIEGQPWYKGADEVDYEALKLEWNAMSLDEQAKANVDFIKAVSK